MAYLVLQLTHEPIINITRDLQKAQFCNFGGNHDFGQAPQKSASRPLLTGSLGGGRREFTMAATAAQLGGRRRGELLLWQVRGEGHGHWAPWPEVWGSLPCSVHKNGCWLCDMHEKLAGSHLEFGRPINIPFHP